MVNSRDKGGRQKKKKNREPQIYCSEGRRRRRGMVNPRDTAGKSEEEEWYIWEGRRRRMVNSQIYSWEGRRIRMINPIHIGGKEKKNSGELQRYSWEGRRRRRMVSPKDTARKAEGEE